MYRISVTTVEKFRRFTTEASTFDTEAALIESLKGIFIGNDKTKFGAAFHKLIEEGGQVTWLNKVPGYLVDSIFFTKEQGDHAMLYRRMHPQMIHEINVSKIYHTRYFPIQVTGRVDCTEGIAIRDAKAKFRNPGDFKEYAGSSQWKFYLDIMETDQFFYDLFEVKGFDSLTRTPPYIIEPDISIISHEPFPCIAYEDMQKDISVLLNEFIDYLHFRNYLHLLKPAIIDQPFLRA